MSSNSVCNHTRDKQIGLPLRGCPICYHSYDYRLNWTPLSPITITKRADSRFGSKEKRHLLSCISATVSTKSSVRKKTTACCNSDQNVGESSPAPRIVLILKSRQKTFRSFQLYFRIAFQGFCFYTVLGINCFLLVIFYLSKIFRVYVARFVYLYLQKFESYPFDFHS